MLRGLLGRDMFGTQGTADAAAREACMHTLCGAEEIPAHDPGIKVEEIREGSPPENRNNPLALSRPHARFADDSFHFAE